MAGWMMYVHALTPIHSGTGQGEGVIDLPVAREKVTTWPFLPGSSIKGVFRDAVEKVNNDAVNEIFGVASDTEESNAGSVWFTDAHLLALPIRSYWGTFAWVTSSLALDRWRRDHLANGLPFTLTLPPSPSNDEVFLASSADLRYKKQVFLEDLAFAHKADAPDNPNKQIDAVADLIARAVWPKEEYADWRGAFSRRFALVSNDIFTGLVKIGTEVSARIRLDDASKTVAKGALWYQEAVPAETIFTAPLIVAPHRRYRADDYRSILSDTTEQILQIGGDATTGKGLVKIQFQPEETA